MHVQSIAFDLIFFICLQPIAFGVSSNLKLQSQSHWSLFSDTWKKRPRERDEDDLMRHLMHDLKRHLIENEINDRNLRLQK